MNNIKIKILNKNLEANFYSDEFETSLYKCKANKNILEFAKEIFHLNKFQVNLLEKNELIFFNNNPYCIIDDENNISIYFKINDLYIFSGNIYFECNKYYFILGDRSFYYYSLDYLKNSLYKSNIVINEDILDKFAANIMINKFN